jgi:hypothetical protein
MFSVVWLYLILSGSLQFNNDVPIVEISMCYIFALVDVYVVTTILHCYNNYKGGSESYSKEV